MKPIRHPFPTNCTCGVMLLLAANAADSAPEPADGQHAAQDQASVSRPGPAPAVHDNDRIRIAKQPRSRIDPLLQDAWHAYRNGRFDQAEHLYLALLRNDTCHTDALLGLAAIALRQNDSPAAAQYYMRILKLDPRNARANAGIAMLQPDDESAISRIKFLQREQGDAAVLHFALGNLYAGQERWNDARQAYASAHLLEPGNAAFVFNLAVSLDHLEQNATALRHYRNALQLDPEQRSGLDHAQIEQRITELIGLTP